MKTEKAISQENVLNVSTVKDVTQRGMIIGLFDNKGYGFIKSDDGKAIFFHATGVIDNFSELREGHTVLYIEVDTPRGSKAIAVIRD